MNSEKTPNKLIDSNSPYLKQHAYNPVQWYPWGNEALQKAKEEDKPIIVSIGYSACHWCHVMERESFENETVATLMNKEFVCIKVDREERPDIDQIYMEAVQTMGLNGGWPLNVITTPDQKPFYGGTYFPPQNWYEMLSKVAEAFKSNREKIDESADAFANALSADEVQKYGLESRRIQYGKQNLEHLSQVLSQRFDPKYGGMDKAPKFPMPSIWHFLLHANSVLKNDSLDDQLELTLDQMALGGIYDQLGGGFCRYSVDGEWHAPHFEKMLYDNAQLIALYAEAFRVYKKPLYKEVVKDTITFLRREMLDVSGGYYAALDADSEGVEGKFYTWTSTELKTALSEDYALFAAYYGVTETGNWEEGVNILHAVSGKEEFAVQQKLSVSELESILEKCKATLMNVRHTRIRPGLDDKILAGWNGMLLQGFAKAAVILNDEEMFEYTSELAEFLTTKMIVGGKVMRVHHKGESSIYGTLEDYAFVISGLIDAYQATFNENYLTVAEGLITNAFTEYHDTGDDLFYYTSSFSEQLIARKKELFDNVIPSSNAVMAHNLYHAGILLDREEWRNFSDDMLSMFAPLMDKEPQYLTHWARLLFYCSFPTAEVAIVGQQYKEKAVELETRNLPNKIMMATENNSSLPLLEGKTEIDGKTALYVCFNKTCKLPATTVEDAVQQFSLP